MCDVVEKHGLVDYQYGIEEERIMLGMLGLEIGLANTAELTLCSPYGMPRPSTIYRRKRRRTKSASRSRRGASLTFATILLTDFGLYHFLLYLISKVLVGIPQISCIVSWYFVTI